MFEFEPGQSYVDAATWLVVTNTNQHDLNQEGVTVTHAHEVTHFWQAISTNFLFWYSASVHFRYFLATQLMFHLFPPGTEKGGEIDMMKLMRADPALLNVSSDGVRTIDVIEGHAVHVSHRIISAALSQREFEVYLNDRHEVGSKYSMAYEYARNHLQEDAYELFSPICFLALQYANPASKFVELCRIAQPWVGEFGRDPQARCPRCSSIHASRAIQEVTARLLQASGGNEADVFPLSVRECGIRAWKDMPAELVGGNDDIEYLGKDRTRTFTHPILDPYVLSFRKRNVSSKTLLAFFSRPYDLNMNCSPEWMKDTQLMMAAYMPPLIFQDGKSTMRGLGSALGPSYKKHLVAITAAAGAVHRTRSGQQTKVYCPHTDCPIHETQMCFRYFEFPKDYRDCDFPDIMEGVGLSGLLQRGDDAVVVVNEFTSTPLKEKRIDTRRADAQDSSVGPRWKTLMVHKWILALWTWIVRRNRAIMTFLLSHLRNPPQRSLSQIRFANITVPDVPYGGQVTSASPPENPFSEPCARYFEFENVDPVLNVKIINRSDVTLLVSAVGVEVVSAAQLWWISRAVVQAHEVRVSKHVSVTMPDVWAMLEEQGVKIEFTEDIDPRVIRVSASANSFDPVYLKSNSPHRYLLNLRKYRERVPDYAILRLWVDTDRGRSFSEKIYVRVRGHIACASGENPDSLLDQADAHYSAGRYKEAEPLMKKALELKEKAIGRDNPNLATILHNLGVIYFKQECYPEAALLLNRATPLMEQKFGPNDPEFVHSLNVLASAYKAQGKDTEAQKVAERITAIENRSPLIIGPGEPTVRPGFVDRLRSMVSEEKFDEAASMATGILDAAEAHYGVGDPATLPLLIDIGGFYYRAENYEKAVSFLERSLEIRQASLGDFHPDVANSLNNLASALREKKEYARAERCYRRAIDILEQAGEAEKKYLAVVLENYAVLLRKTGRSAESANVDTRAARLRASE